MNILYYYHYAGSIESPREWRAYHLSKAYTELGHNVSVVTASYHHLHKNKSQQTVNVKQKNVDGINYYWLKTPDYIGNGLGRIKNMLAFGYSTLFKDPVKSLHIEKPDIVIASSVHPFHVLAAIRWARKYNAKVCFEVRDPWPLSLNLLLGVSKWHPFSLLLQFFQYIGHKFTDKTISTAINLDQYMVKHGLDTNKYIYACNGIDINQDQSDTSILDSELIKIRNKYKRILMYTGSHGTPNALYPLIEGFNQVKNDEIALVMIGQGNEKSRLQKISDNSNCYFFDPIEKREIQRVLSFADICVISWKDLPLYQYGVSPNKIFDYMLAKKPIIQAINSKGNQVEIARSGLNILPENADFFADAINSMCAKEDNELKALGENGYSYLINHCQYSQIAQHILSEVEK